MQYASVTYWLTLVFAIFIPIGFLNIFATQNIFDFICTIFISSVLIWTYFLMEKIGHFLDDEVTDLYQECKNNGLSKREASPVIAEKLDIAKILKRASKGWDGGYAMAGLLGHGDSFVFRDPAGIRPASEPVRVPARARRALRDSLNLLCGADRGLRPRAACRRQGCAPRASAAAPRPAPSS